MKRLIMGALCAAGLLAGGVTSQALTVNISGQLTGTHNWVNTNEYVLNGYVYVLSNAVLNIEAGTVVRGKPGVAPNFGALYVCRGGKLNAVGTRSQPIIFTSELDVIDDPNDIPLTAAGRALWGGVVLLGNGLINRADATSVNGLNPDGSKWQIYEGLADVNGSDGLPLHRFGGNNNDDSSGIIKFVSIRHGGINLTADKEINGLSMGAVGRGTTVENVEVYMCADDGFEWWGGAVNSRYLAATFCDDECFDMDEGHIGKHQFWFGLQGIASDEGLELNGQPSGGANVNIVGATPLGRHQIYNVTLIGNKTDAGNDVMNTRSEYYGEIYNSVFMDFSGADQVSSVTTYNGIVENNHFFNNSGNGIANANNVRTSNAINPLLRNTDKTRSQLLDPRPQSGSPLLSGAKTTPTDGFFIPAPYKGAFASTENWLLAWTALSQNLHIPQQTNIVNVSGQLTGTINWSASNQYVLNGYVYVLSNAVLNIEAGTIIRGKPGVAPNFGALYVCRGGKLNALGTESAPIIFTSELDDLTDPNDIPLTGAGRALWGGVVLLGNGLINRADATSVNGLNPDGSKWQIYEGLADVNGSDGLPLHRFGGNNNDDSSGTIRYVSIRHGGINLTADKEINGLSMGGVGRGTTVENVDVYMCADDGFEWWGGAVGSRYLSASFCDDECFDMDEGHSGLHQFWFGLQGIASDEGLELNGQPSGGANVNIVGATPLGRHQIFNATLIGNKVDGGNDVMNTRSEYYGEIYDSIFMDFSGSSQVSSVANYRGTVTQNLFFNNGANGILDTVNNTIANPLIASTDKTRSRLLDPRPAAGSPAYTGWRTPPVNGWFAQAAHKGGFDQRLWVSKWTALSDNAHLARSGADSTAPMPTVSPEVAVVGDNVTVSWTALPGLSYQVQVSTDLVTWTNDGAAQKNSGEASVTQNHASSIAGAGVKKHYRVIASN